MSRKIMLSAAAIFIVILLFSGLLWGRSNINFVELIECQRCFIEGYVQEHYWYSVIFYCVAFLIATVLVIPLTVVLSVLGGFLYGPFWGAVYATISIIAALMIIFYFARWFAQDLIRLKYGNYLDRFQEEMDQWGWVYLSLAQLLPATPLLLLGILGGLSKLSGMRFAGANILGLFPATLLYTVSGSYLSSLTDEIPKMSPFYFSIIMGLLLMFFVIIRWYFRKRVQSL